MCQTYVNGVHLHILLNEEIEASCKFLENIASVSNAGTIKYFSPTCKLAWEKGVCTFTKWKSYCHVHIFCNKNCHINKYSTRRLSLIILRFFHVASRSHYSTRSPCLRKMASFKLPKKTKKRLLDFCIKRENLQDTCATYKVSTFPRFSSLKTWKKF